MKYLNNGENPEGILIKSWCNNPESGALDQAKNLARLPFAFKHIALMPDTHQGFGMPIGGVLAADGVVVPNAVGVDIGCGMIAIRLNIFDMNQETLKRLLGNIRKRVPVGFDKHQNPVDPTYLPKKAGDGVPTPIVDKELEKSRWQLGTLGGGNHFIEIQEEAFSNLTPPEHRTAYQPSAGYVWVMIHSGSRNLGKQICDHYDAEARALNAKWKVAVPPSYDLAFLPLETIEAKLYLAEMEYAMRWAEASRAYMMDEVLQAFAEEIPDWDNNKSIDWDTKVHICHNYARLENHFGKDVVVHRKGAISAKDGELGIVPGSQGTASYITVGKGNPESFMTSSHGAGRVLSRNVARQTLKLEDEIKILEDQGIVHAIRHEKDLDEAPSAYKDIQVVMEEQKDLIDIAVRLKPLAVLKG